MISSLKFIGWKIVELFIYVVAFPFFFIGAWGIEASDWCGDRAIKHDARLHDQTIAED